MATFPPVPWTMNDEKLFEQALIQLPLENSPYFLENISQLLQKPIEEVKYYYDALVSQLLQKPIESSEVALPKYPEDHYLPITEEHIPKRKEPERKKRGTPWTKYEHECFLVGLKKFGKGDWKNISRECVKTRTSVQVASHAQKYFLRQNSDSKKRKRSSIHDITLNVPHGSNLESMNQQQQYFVEEHPPEWFYGYDQVANMFDEASNVSLLL